LVRNLAFSFSLNNFGERRQMTSFKLVTIAAAVAAALGGPAALAQQSGTPDSSDRVQQRDATGNPSGSPTQPPRSTTSERGTNDPNSRSRGIPSGTPDSSVQQRDATGNPSGSPTQPPRSMSSDRGTNDPNSRLGSERTMGHGQYGASTVRDVQRALQSKGYDVGPVDGVMGPRTEAALQEFQQKQGLTPSGRIDQRTMSALEVQSSGRSGG
jgi:hypothetical protein